MPVYMVVDITVRDARLYDEYVARVPQVLAKFGGKYVVRSGEVTPLAGAWTPDRIVIVEFPSDQAREEFAASPEYRQIAHLRERGAITRAVSVRDR